MMLCPLFIHQFTLGVAREFLVARLVLTAGIVALMVLIIITQSVAVREHLQKPVKSSGWMIS